MQMEYVSPLLLEWYPQHFYDRRFVLLSSFLF